MKERENVEGGNRTENFVIHKKIGHQPRKKKIGKPKGLAGGYSQQAKK